MDITLLKAAALINNADVIAVPTETVYGLAASLYQPLGIDKIFTLKGRPANNPLIIHVSEAKEIIPFVEDMNADFYKLAEKYWPGPLTLVLPVIEKKISTKVRANLPTAAFRVPNHPLARELLKLTGPLVMPSANLSGKPSATSKSHVEADFGLDFPVLDGGDCIKGLESTILYCDLSDKEKPWKIIRQGALAQNDFLEVLGYEPDIIKPKNNENPICPGQLYRHYAPKAKLELTKAFPDHFTGTIVGFDEGIYPEDSTVYLLGSLKNPETISNNLYRILRMLDDDEVEVALVDVNFLDQGILSTVLERLKKASLA